jgi:hypothetical protein
MESHAIHPNAHTTSMMPQNTVNETKFEIYCNDKTESHHITENPCTVLMCECQSVDKLANI